MFQIFWMAVISLMICLVLTSSILIIIISWSTMYLEIVMDIADTVISGCDLCLEGNKFASGNHCFIEKDEDGIMYLVDTRWEKFFHCLITCSGCSGKKLSVRLSHSLSAPMGLCWISLPKFWKRWVPLTAAFRSRWYQIMSCWDGMKPSKQACHPSSMMPAHSGCLLQCSSSCTCTIIVNWGSTFVILPCMSTDVTVSKLHCPLLSPESTPQAWRWNQHCLQEIRLWAQWVETLP